jgi:hypothetical protein
MAILSCLDLAGLGRLETAMELYVRSAAPRFFTTDAVNLGVLISPLTQDRSIGRAEVVKVLAFITLHLRELVVPVRPMPEVDAEIEAALHGMDPGTIHQEIMVRTTQRLQATKAASSQADVDAPAEAVPVPIHPSPSRASGRSSSSLTPHPLSSSSISGRLSSSSISGRHPATPGQPSTSSLRMTTSGAVAVPSAPRSQRALFILAGLLMCLAGAHLVHQYYPAWRARNDHRNADAQVEPWVLSGIISVGKAGIFGDTLVVSVTEDRFDAMSEQEQARIGGLIHQAAGHRAIRAVVLITPKGQYLIRIGGRGITVSRMPKGGA